MNLKISLLFIAALAITDSYAQNTFPGSGNVGIGTGDPVANLAVYPLLSSGPGANIATTFIAGTHSVLGNTVGSYLYPFEFQHSNEGNIDRLMFSPYRRIAGTTWGGTAYRIQFAVDNSFTEGSKAFIEVGASDPNIDGGGFISLGTASLDRLVITNDGYVGIGTNAPKEALSVNGKIRAKEVKVEGGVWPDYVFKTEYPLMPLTDLKAYIIQNRHLPEFPSEKEVAEKGLNLGEMNMLLTKKVEELTLYLIDKDKELKDQKVINQSAEQRMKKLEQQMELLIKAKK